MSNQYIYHFCVQRTIRIIGSPPQIVTADGIAVTDYRVCDADTLERLKSQISKDGPMTTLISLSLI